MNERLDPTSCSSYGNATLTCSRTQKAGAGLIITRRHSYCPDRCLSPLHRRAQELGSRSDHSFGRTLPKMQWNTFTDQSQLDTVDAASTQRPMLIFKHSTRCSISSAALARLERAWTSDDDQRHAAYFLDLIRHRDASNAIAQRYGVQHESPQVLVIRNGKCVYTASHFGIAYADVIAQLAT
jgi:bacillithiol system protein YtxJ